MCGDGTTSSSDDINLSFSSSRLESSGGSDGGNTNGSNSNVGILPALILSVSHQSRESAVSSIPSTSPSPFPINEKGKTTWCNTTSNNKNNSNHQDVTVFDISLSQTQRTISNPVAGTSIPTPNDNSGYRATTTLQLIPTSASLQRYQQQQQQQQGGGCSEKDMVCYTTAAADVGTVDFLLMNGGGCDEWELRAEDF